MSENFVLIYCDKCIQMTNHLNGICQKCNTGESNSVIDNGLLNELIDKYPDEELMVADGFNDAIIGASEDFNSPVRIMYSVSNVWCWDI